jgi:signal transduction histidine kinase
MAADSTPAATPGQLEAALASIDDATAALGLSGRSRRQARSRAQALHRACGSSPEATAIVAVSYAAELLSRVAVDLAAEPAEARRLIWQLEARAGIPRMALEREVLQTGRLLELPVDVALEARLGLLVAFTGARAAALFARDGAREPRMLSCSGDPLWDAPPYHEIIRDLLTVAEETPASHSVAAMRLERLRPPQTTLLVAPVDVSPEEAELLLGAAAPILTALLDREGAATPDPAGQEALLGSVERRLARLRFDLHDGPQQDVHLLAQDLALFREQLRPAIADDPNASRLVGRLDDLEAQLVALDGDLRRLSSAVQSPLVVPGSIPEALRTLTASFADRTGVEPEVHINGPLPELSESQHIALLSLIREGLSNIRKHSRATHVEITVTADSRGVHAEVRDDGQGFDPEQSLVAAARAGRLGLVGMHERVRMLGGRTRIESQPGGPTIISATLPPWPGDSPDSGD